MVTATNCDFEGPPLLNPSPDVLTVSMQEWSRAPRLASWYLPILRQLTDSDTDTGLKGADGSQSWGPAGNTGLEMPSFSWVC